MRFVTVFRQLSMIIAGLEDSLFRNNPNYLKCVSLFKNIKVKLNRIILCMEDYFLLCINLLELLEE